MTIPLSPEAAQKDLTKAKGIIDRFINSCSHNLKNPLSSIEGLVMIADYCTNPKEVKQCLDMIQLSVTHMLEIIHKLEDYTTVQHRKLSRNTIDAQRLAEMVVHDFKREIDQQEITVSIKVTQTSRWISDEHCTYLILKNLIANSIHFNDFEKKSKTIDISVHVGECEISLEVADNGIGIVEEDQEKIFEAFHRSSIQSKGNGLGLFLVKGAIEKLKASIVVQSSEKSGASFRVLIPNNMTL